MNVDDVRKETPLKKKTCILCGKELNNDSQYCNYCGADQNKIQNSQNSNNINTSKVDETKSKTNDMSPAYKSLIKAKDTSISILLKLAQVIKKKLIPIIKKYKIEIPIIAGILVSFIGWLIIFINKIETINVHIILLIISVITFISVIIFLIKCKLLMKYIILSILSIMPLILLSSIFFLKATAVERKYLEEVTNGIFEVYYAVEDYSIEAKVNNNSYYSVVEKTIEETLKLEAPKSLEKYDSIIDEYLTDLKKDISAVNKGLSENNNAPVQTQIEAMKTHNRNLLHFEKGELENLYREYFIHSSYTEINGKYEGFVTSRMQYRNSLSIFMTNSVNQLMALHFGINDYLIETAQGNYSYYDSSVSGQANLKALLNNAKVTSPNTLLNEYSTLINNYVGDVNKVVENINSSSKSNNQNEINNGRANLASLDKYFIDVLIIQLKEISVKNYLVTEFENTISLYPSTYKSGRTIYREQAEAQAKAKAEAEAKAKAEAEAKAKAKAEAEAKALAEKAREIQEFKDSCSNYSYDEIARTPSSYFLKRAYFRGEVVQIIEGSGRAELRVSVKQGSYGIWSADHIIYVTYDYYDLNNRILEDDIINIWGTLEGTKTYSTIFGSSVTIPLLDARYIEIE